MQTGTTIMHINNMCTVAPLKIKLFIVEITLERQTRNTYKIFCTSIDARACSTENSL